MYCLKKVNFYYCTALPSIIRTLVKKINRHVTFINTYWPNNDNLRVITWNILFVASSNYFFKKRTIFKSVYRFKEPDI